MENYTPECRKDGATSHLPKAGHRPVREAKGRCLAAFWAQVGAGLDGGDRGSPKTLSQLVLHPSQQTLAPQAVTSIPTAATPGFRWAHRAWGDTAPGLSLPPAPPNCGTHGRKPSRLP